VTPDGERVLSLRHSCFAGNNTDSQQIYADAVIGWIRAADPARLQTTDAVNLMFHPFDYARANGDAGVYDRFFAAAGALSDGLEPMTVSEYFEDW